MTARWAPMCKSTTLTPEDFWGKEGCNELLVLSRPDVIRAIHASFFEAGCDVVETDSFGSTSIVLAEYDLQDRTRELNLAAARLAREVADAYSTPEQPRFVAGSIGPTTKLPSLGHIGFDAMAAAYRVQAEALIEGGVDVLLIETCQDLLQAKIAIAACQDAIRDAREGKHSLDRPQRCPPGPDHSRSQRDHASRLGDRRGPGGS